MKKGKEWLKKETGKLYKHDEAYLNPDDIVVENYQTVTSILELIDQLDDNYTIEKPKLLTVIVKDYDETLHRQQVPKEVANEIVKLLQSTQREVTE